MSSTILLILALVAVALSLAWLALETRAVHLAIDRYAAEMRSWQALMQVIDQRQQREER